MSASIASSKKSDAKPAASSAGKAAKESSENSFVPVTDDVLNEAHVSDFMRDTLTLTPFFLTEGVILDYVPLLGDDVWKATFVPDRNVLSFEGVVYKYALLEVSEKAVATLSRNLGYIGKNIHFDKTSRSGIPPRSDRWGNFHRMFVVGTDDSFILNRLWLLTGNFVGSGLLEPPALKKSIHEYTHLSSPSFDIVKGSERVYLALDGVKATKVFPGSKMTFDNQTITVTPSEYARSKYVHLSIDDALYVRKKDSIRGFLEAHTTPCELMYEDMRVLVHGKTEEVMSFLTDFWLELELPVHASQYLGSMSNWLNIQREDEGILLIQLQRLIDSYVEKRVQSAVAAIPTPAPAVAQPSPSTPSVAASVQEPVESAPEASIAPIVAPIVSEKKTKVEKLEQEASTGKPVATKTSSYVVTPTTTPPLAVDVKPQAVVAPVPSAPVPTPAASARAPAASTKASKPVATPVAPSNAPSVPLPLPVPIITAGPPPGLTAPEEYHIRTHPLKLGSEITFGEVGNLRVEDSMANAMNKMRFFRLSKYLGEYLQANDNQGLKHIKTACKMSVMDKDTSVNNVHLGYCILLKGEETKRVEAQNILRELLRKLMNQPPSVSDLELGVDLRPPFFLNA